MNVFENRILRRIFGRVKEIVTRGWRRLHNEELHNLYSSTDVVRMIESKRMKWAEHVALIGETRNA
jgi:hypothetical protein